MNNNLHIYGPGLSSGGNLINNVDDGLELVLVRNHTYQFVKEHVYENFTFRRYITSSTPYYVVYEDEPTEDGPTIT